MKPAHIIYVAHLMTCVVVFAARPNIYCAPVYPSGWAGRYTGILAAEIGTNGSWPPEARLTPHIPGGLFKAFTHGLIVLNKALWGY